MHAAINMKKELKYNDRKIDYSTAGAGKTIMLVHGFGEDNTVWDDQVEVLEKKFFVITPNLPGTGESELIGDMSMSGMAEVLKQILDKEEIGSCAMVGHSMGGYITLAFAEKYPDMLHAFGLFHSSAYADSEEKKDTRRKGIAFIKQHSGYEFLKTATPNLFSPKTQEERPELVEKQVEAGRSLQGDALVAYYEAMMARPDRTDILKKTKVPVLFVMGKHDKAVPMDDSLKQSHLPEIAHVHVLQDAGHMGMLEETEKSNRILDDFVATTGT